MGVWCGTQRYKKRKNKLPLDRETKMEELNGWYWDYGRPINTHQHSEGTKSTNDYNEILEDMINDRGEKKYQLKEVRNHQRTFREKIISKYKSCIITHKPPDMCEACHIIPYSENEKKRYDINNGLLLSADLHRLFDKYCWSINPNTSKIAVSASLRLNKQYQSINQYHGQFINLDKKTLINLNKHFREFEQKQNN